MPIINKVFQPCLTFIQEAFADGVYTAMSGAPFLNGRSVSIKNEHRRFELAFTLKDKEVVKYHNSIPRTVFSDLHLKSANGLLWDVPSDAVLLKKFKNDDINPFELDCMYAIDRVHVNEISDQERYWRLIMPLPEKNEFDFYDFSQWAFEVDVKHKSATLLKVAVSKQEFHFFHIRMEGRSFFGVDATTSMKFDRFQDAAIAIQTAYAFICGRYYLDEAFYISSTSAEFTEDLGVRYTALRESIISSYSIFTTNGSRVLAKLRESQGLDWNNEINEWTKKLYSFDPVVLDALATLFYEKESLSRAAFIILEANGLALELKAAAYCVAYEGICHTIKEKLQIKSPSVMPKASWKKEIKPFFERGLSELLRDGLIDQAAYNILSRKIDNLNQPTNKDALTAPFTHFNYTLKPYEEKAIADRNSFLHGSVPLKTTDIEVASKSLYFTALTIHKLAYILLLKLSGFEGYIINYAKLHEDMTHEVLEQEDGFIYI